MSRSNSAARARAPSRGRGFGPSFSPTDRRPVLVSQPQKKVLLLNPDLDPKVKAAKLLDLVTFLRTFERDIAFLQDITAAGLNGPASLDNTVLRIQYHHFYLILHQKIDLWRTSMPAFRKLGDVMIPDEIIDKLYNFEDPIEGHVQLQKAVKSINREIESIVRISFLRHLQLLPKAVYGDSYHGTDQTDKSIKESLTWHD
ncbi:hypothetical protein TWF696_004733 [Orbilia brochopaga]|uniref:Uncharacterized protein n=1 Tax=Orbilia brochopaga TaxID=3140254 RepID=A0AAV9V1P4_9PEZI